MSVPSTFTTRQLSSTFNTCQYLVNLLQVSSLVHLLHGDVGEEEFAFHLSTWFSKASTLVHLLQISSLIHLLNVSTQYIYCFPAAELILKRQCPSAFTMYNLHKRTFQNFNGMHLRSTTCVMRTPGASPDPPETRMITSRHNFSNPKPLNP